MKKIVSLALSLLLGSTLLLAGCGGSSGGKANTQPQTLNLFSWADNFDPEVLAEFEKKYIISICSKIYGMNS